MFLKVCSTYVRLVYDLYNAYILVSLNAMVFCITCIETNLAYNICINILMIVKNILLLLSHIDKTPVIMTVIKQKAVMNISDNSDHVGLHNINNYQLTEIGKIVT